MFQDKPHCNWSCLLAPVLQGWLANLRCPRQRVEGDVLSWWLVSALKLSLSCPVLTTFSSLSDTYLNNCLWTCNGYNCNKRDVILEKRVDLPELALVKNEELSYGTISARTCLGTCSIQREACMMSGKLYTQMYLMQIMFAWSVHRLPSILSRC